MLIEYRVRPVTRYIVTRFVADESSQSSGVVGEFPSEQLARDVAHAFAGQHASVAIGDGPSLIGSVEGA